MCPENEAERERRTLGLLQVTSYERGYKTGIVTGVFAALTVVFGLRAVWEVFL